MTHPGQPPQPQFGFRCPLRDGDVIKMMDGSTHYVKYVNSSGAFAIPLTSTIVREIHGQTVNGHAGGRTISANSFVEVIDPLTLGGNSHEYRRYVTMVSQSGATAEGNMGKRKGKAGNIVPPEGSAGASLGQFDPESLPEDWEEQAGSGAAEGHSTTTESSTAQSGDSDMAKKAAKKANGKARAEKPPKTVRNCVCGCGTETTGHFAPGHDARYHGWVKKLADGRMEPKELAPGLRAKMELVQTKDGFKAKNPDFYKTA